jgi:hypothetical protein
MPAEEKTKAARAEHQGPCYEDFDALDSVEWSLPRSDRFNPRARVSGAPLHGRQETQSPSCGEEKGVLPPELLRLRKCDI